MKAMSQTRECPRCRHRSALGRRCRWSRVFTGGGSRRTYPRPCSKATLSGAASVQVTQWPFTAGWGTANCSIAEQSTSVYQGAQSSGTGRSIVHSNLTRERCMMGTCRHQSLTERSPRSSGFHWRIRQPVPICPVCQDVTYTGNFWPPKPMAHLCSCLLRVLRQIQR